MRGIQEEKFLGGGTTYELRTKQNLVAKLSNERLRGKTATSSQCFTRGDEVKQIRANLATR
ncbi:MAG: hypothetical protein DMG40_27555 [Acidobacteria bacterium]|nr:MAG: hypothetical protein DMG40_27555 [Acidobacteriota bacterium]